MALNFPASPVNGQTYNSGSAIYTWSSAAQSWEITANSLSSGVVNGILYIDSTASVYSTASGALEVWGGVGADYLAVRDTWTNVDLLAAITALLAN